MKRVKKILLSLLVVVMVLGNCLTAQAATKAKYATMKSISVTDPGSGKNVSSITVYTGETPKELNVAYTQGYGIPNSVEIKNSNRGVVTAVWSKVPSKGTATLQLTGKSNGKAVVTIVDKNNKKSKKIKVTVKTYADELEFDENVVTYQETTDGKDFYRAEVAVGGKVNLGAVAKASGTVSDKSIKYVKSYGNTFSVDKKGNVSVKKNVSASKDSPLGTVTVIAKGSKDQLVQTVVHIFAVSDDVTSIKAINEEGKPLKTLKLKGNLSNIDHTHKLKLILGGTVEEGTLPSEVLKFVSSNTKVATVDDEGIITAHANGTAKITISSWKGKAKPVKVTVKVTTDPELVSLPKESIELIANGKATAKIGAAINSRASKKTVKYKILKVTDLNDAPIADKDFAKYISVNSKGVVKAKKSCTAQIRAYSGVKDKYGNYSVWQNIDVYARVPVSTVTLKPADDSSVSITNNKALVWITGEDEQDNLTQENLTLEATASSAYGTPDNDEVIWSTSNAKVATVEDGVVTAHANGKAKITATAADGSKKKATVTVTVKTKAYEINVPKADENNFVYVKLTDKNKGKNVSASSLLSASTNKNASNKGLIYITSNPSSSTKVTVPLTVSDEEYDAKVRIETKDRFINDENPEIYFIKFIAGEEEIASKFDIDLSCEVNDEDVLEEEENGKSVCMFAGDTLAVTADVDVSSAQEGKKMTVNPTVKWKSNKTGVAKVSKTGVITAVKPGVATITASFEGAENQEVTVYVGDKQATVVNTINKAVAAKIKDENRDWTGINTKFDSKTNTFNLAILDADQDLSVIEDTGITVALAAIQRTGYYFNNVVITDKATGKQWKLNRTNLDKVSIPEIDIENASLGEALTAVMTDSANSKGEVLLKDWNGKEYDVIATAEYDEIKAAKKNFEYELNYTIKTTMSDKVYDEHVDNLIALGREKVENREKVKAGMAAIGIGSVDYNPSNNTFEVVASKWDTKVVDTYKLIKDKGESYIEGINPDEVDKEALEAVANRVYDLAGDMLKNATSVTISYDVKGVKISDIKIPGKLEDKIPAIQVKDTVTVNRDDYNTDEDYIEDVVNRYLDNMPELPENYENNTTYGDLNGTVAKIFVTFKTGEQFNTVSYEVYYGLTRAAHEAYNKAIEAQISSLSEEEGAAPEKEKSEEEVTKEEVTEEEKTEEEVPEEGTPEEETPADETPEEETPEEETPAEGEETDEDATGEEETGDEGTPEEETSADENAEQTEEPAADENAEQTEEPAADDTVEEVSAEAADKEVSTEIAE